MNMKAIVVHPGGSEEGIQLEEVPLPEPAEEEVLVRIRAAAVNPLDWKVIQGIIPRKKFPFIPGCDFAGVIESVGPDAGDYEAGDPVFGYVDLLEQDGVFAEYVCLPISQIATMPANMSFEEAAGLATAACTALQALRDRADIRDGMDVLINGASGGVGHFAVQIAKFYGAYVTAVCGPENTDLVYDLGADRVIDYTREDFTRERAQYDIIFDAVAKSSPAACRHLLKPEGVFLTTENTSGIGFQNLFSLFSKKKARVVELAYSEDDLWELKKLAEASQIRTQVGSIFPFNRAGVEQALALSQSGHARGKAIIKY